MYKTIGGLSKQAPMTHFKDRLAPLTPETSEVREKTKGDGLPTPQAAGQGKSPKIVPLPTVEERL